MLPSVAPKTTAPNRRDLITAAALRRMTTLGYEGTTVGDIAADLGISKAAIVYYFRRKEDFLAEFVTPVLDRLEAALDEAETVEEAVAGYLAVLIDFHEQAKWIDTDPAVRSHAEFGPRLDAINQRLLRSIAGGSRRSADRIRALTVLGGIWRPTRELTTAELDKSRDEIVRAALAGS